nr:amidohydrolase family protein [Zhihengliuella flava]
MYRNGSIYSPADPFATAMLVVDGTIAWIGQDPAASALIDEDTLHVDLEGALIAPAFFDSHVHLTEVGAALDHLNLMSIGSREELLEAVRARAAAEPGSPIVGYGWDESNWSDPTLPTRAELDAAGAGADVYLARVDVHSALVGGPLAAAESLPSAYVSGEDHLPVRARALDYDDAQRRRYQRAALTHFASHGYAGVAEMSAPHISGRHDAALLEELLAAEGDSVPLVRLYWAGLTSDESEARDLASSFGPAFAGLGGDLNIDGSIGSRTAALHRDYADAPGERGTLALSAELIATHLVACTRAGIQAGFHVIGDAGAAAAASGFRSAADIVGAEALQRVGHRLEHAEMIDDDTLDVLLAYRVTLSMQPTFDAAWAGPGGLYEERLGAERADRMNQMGRLLSAGVPVCTGSDAPVRPVDPWGAVKACLELRAADSRISARAAFLAHTRAGYRAAGAQVPFDGQLVPGADATFAVWSASELMVQTPDSRVASWSTDARAGTPMLPALDSEFPHCLLTVRAGRTLYSAGVLSGV